MSNATPAEGFDLGPYLEDPTRPPKPSDELRLQVGSTADPEAWVINVIGWLMENKHPSLALSDKARSRIANYLKSRYPG